MNSKKITIQDIARHAKVSAGTVDRVLHNRGKVSDDKKKKIEEAIQELNFNPNLLARALAMQKEYRVCCLFPKSFSENDYWHLPRQGAEQASVGLKDFGFFLEMYFYSLFDESSFTEQANALLAANPDGVILAPLFSKESILFTKRLEEHNIPYVFIDATIAGQQNLSYIGPDAERSGLVAAKLLSTSLLPDHHILILNIVKGIENSANVRLIEKGFRDYFNNPAVNSRYQISSLAINSSDKETITQELTKYYIKHPDIKGVFVTTSRAHYVADFHQKHDLDIRLIGFDLVEENIAHLRNNSIDWIISQSPIQQGARAVKTLFDLFIYNTQPRKIQHVPLDIIIPENLDYYLDFQ